MTSINWCLKQKKGIRLIEPSDIMSEDYIKRAENDLESMVNTKDHWKLITAYYACYDILYALLIKAGIKSEIHDCSIALMQLFNFDNDSIEFIKKLKDDRIQVQYYLKDISLSDTDKVKRFVLAVKEKIANIKDGEIKKIRDKLR